MNRQIYKIERDYSWTASLQNLNTFQFSDIIIHRYLDRQRYIYRDRQIDGQIDRYKDRWIDRQKDRQIDRQIDRQVPRLNVL